MEERNITLTNNIAIGNIGFWLTVVFIILKLTGVIQWAWVIVFLPLLIAIGITVITLVIAIIIVLFCCLYNKHRED